MACAPHNKTPTYFNRIIKRQGYLVYATMMAPAVINKINPVVFSRHIYKNS